MGVKYQVVVVKEAGVVDGEESFFFEDDIVAIEELEEITAKDKK